MSWPLRFSFAVSLLLLTPAGPLIAFADRSFDEAATAAEVSSQQLEKNPADEKAWATLVEARLEMNQAEWAEKALTEWASKVPSPSPAVIRLRGEVAFSRGKYDEAIGEWTRYLDSTPDDAGARKRLADAFEREHKWPEAIRELTKAFEAKPTAKDLSRRAALYVRAHDWKAAEADIREANQLDATDRAVQLLYPAFERGNTWIPAVTRLDQALAKDPANATLLLDRAEWFAGLGLLDVCRDDIDAAWKANPKSLRARIWRGVLAWDRHQREDAGELLEMPLQSVTTEFEKELRAVDANPDPEVRATFLLKYKQPLLALGEVEETTGSPAKAHALLELGRLAEAGAASRSAVTSHPKDGSAWFALARVEIENGNLTEGLDALKRCTALAKNRQAEDLRKATQLRLGK